MSATIAIASRFTDPVYARLLLGLLLGGFLLLRPGAGQHVGDGVVAFVAGVLVDHFVDAVEG